MTPKYRIPHVETAEVVRPHVLRLTFDDGLVRDLEFVAGGHAGTVFDALDDPGFCAKVAVDPTSRTIVWPNGVDLDPAVLHGDFEPIGPNHFRDVTQSENRVRSR